MRKYLVGVGIAILFLFVLLWQPAEFGKAGAEEPSTQTAASQEEKQFDQEQAIAELRKQIGDKKTLPAEPVFQNIQVLKGIPAGGLLSVMQTAYSKSLGVDCTYCHIENHWEIDDKPHKQVAREMVLMTRAINKEYLQKMEALESDQPAVNCTTCHRGRTKPALDLD